MAQTHSNGITRNTEGKWYYISLLFKLFSRLYHMVFVCFDEILMKNVDGLTIKRIKSHAPLLEYR